MIILEEYKNLTIRELETLAENLIRVNDYKSFRIVEILDELFWIINDKELNLILNKPTENNQNIIFEK